MASHMPVLPSAVLNSHETNTMFNLFVFHFEDTVVLEIQFNVCFFQHEQTLLLQNLHSDWLNNKLSVFSL